ncbi:MAG: heavy metal translocating P-type ATPase [Patescibacteria group bacterium]
METETLEVKGMHCASCQQLITGKIKNLNGVSDINVNFATEKAKVTYDPTVVTIQKMNDEIGKYGYSLRGKTDHSMHSMANHKVHNMSDMGMHHDHSGVNMSKEMKLKELEEEKNKTEFALPIALVVFTLMIWDIAAKTFINIPKIPVPMDVFNIISLILATPIMFWIGKPFIDGVVTFIKHGVANMDTLIGIGTLTAYIYSAILLLFPPIRSLLNAPEYLYLDVVIVVIGFVKLGKYLEARSKLKTGEAIEKLIELQAKSAIVLRDGKELEIPISEVVIGDVIVVKPGSKIPVDGVVTDGMTSIDESMISGEPMPVDKKSGDLVIGSTINKQGSIRFKATKVGSDTMLAQIIKLVEEAQGSRAPIQGLADKISSIFVPTVLIIALATFAAWVFIGSSYFGLSVAISYGLMCFVGILVIACPCALGLATPTAIVVGVGKGAEHGILIKDAEALEKLKDVKTIVFDKTGTITEGKPMVTDVISLDTKYPTDRITQYAASIENHSEHPLAKAVVEELKAKNIEMLNVAKFMSKEGVGVEGEVNSEKFKITKPEVSDHSDDLTRLQAEGKTVVTVKNNGNLIGLIAISDKLKPEINEAIKRIRAKKIDVVMLTGDNSKAAKYIAKKAGIDNVIAEVLPKDKSAKIKELQQKGSLVAMVGDGVNDAPALTQADVGLAMATGTDVAIESADIVLLKGDVKKVYEAMTLSKATVNTIKQNLFWAFIYNVVGIPLAAGALFPFTGLLLNPIFAGMAMASSSVSVVLNSLRLRMSKISY